MSTNLTRLQRLAAPFFFDSDSRRRCCGRVWSISIEHYVQVPLVSCMPTAPCLLTLLDPQWYTSNRAPSPCHPGQDAVWRHTSTLYSVVTFISSLCCQQINCTAKMLASCRRTISLVSPHRDYSVLLALLNDRSPGSKIYLFASATVFLESIHRLTRTYSSNFTGYGGITPHVSILVRFDFHYAPSTL